MKEKKVAALALSSQSLRLLSGPITLLVISSELSPEVMSFYFSFLSLIAMQQLLEMGLGFTVKQFIAHAYHEDDNTWSSISIMKIKAYYKFSMIWFLVLAIFIVIVVGLFGAWFFSSYSGDIAWEYPWLALVLSTGLTTLVTPVQFLVEGCQKQIEYYKARLISGVINAIVICFSLLSGLGLYSLSLSVIFSNLALYFILRYEIMSILVVFNKNKIESNAPSVKDTFFEMWPMLSKMSLTWCTGYFFWNSFNLLAFKFLSTEMSGKFGFTLLLARSGFAIAESVVASQSTLYSQSISKGDIQKAKHDFNKSMIASLFILFSGYSIFVVGFYIYPQFYMFEKVLNVESTIQIFIYFFLLLPVLLQANFCRCFKDEPYVNLSLFCNFSVPIVFYFSLVMFNEVVFAVLLPLSIIFILWSMKIMNKTAIIKV